MKKKIRYAWRYIKSHKETYTDCDTTLSNGKSFKVGECYNPDTFYLTSVVSSAETGMIIRPALTTEPNEANHYLNETQAGGDLYWLLDNLERLPHFDKEINEQQGVYKLEKFELVELVWYQPEIRLVEREHYSHFRLDNHS
jgi:hypothetical protein